ncbi:hypothetical protein ACFDTO_10265 [Microbacteriaceae bacterium 4G12]
MSTNAAYAAPRTRSTASRPGVARPHIEIVSTRDQRRARPRTVYATLVIGGLFAVLLSQLLLSIGLSDGAYAIQSLQQKQRDLGRTQQVLSEDLERLSSPQNLAANAGAMGMVSNATPVYLRLSDAAVLGAPVAASADESAEPLVGNVLLDDVKPAADQIAKANVAAAAAAGADADEIAAVQSGNADSGVLSVPSTNPSTAALASGSSIPAPITR